MPRTTRVVTGLGAVALAFSLGACSSSGGGTTKTTAAGGSSSSSSASSSPSTDTSASDTSSSATTDYASLLIEASDIPIPGFEKGTPATPPQGTGTTVAFTGEGGRTLGVTILVLPSAEAAQAAATSAADAAKTSVTGAEVSDAPIGSGGTAIRGTNDSGAVAALVFSEGVALIVMEFDSAADDPVPTDVIQQVATAQDDKVKSGLPG